MNIHWIKTQILSFFPLIDNRNEIASNYLYMYKVAVVEDQQRKFEIIDAKLCEIKAKRRL